MSVAPLERSSLKNVLQMVPTHLKQLRAPLEQLLREINDEYLLSVKRASGMFSIKIKVWDSGTDFTLKTLAFIFCLFLSSIVIPVEFTFGFSKKNEEGKSRDLPPHRLE